MQIAFSVNGVPIRLTDERWAHILAKHPEMKLLKEKVLETVKGAKMVQRGDVGTFMAVTEHGGKFIVVVYREVTPEDGFVITAYRAEILKPREVVWKPSK